MDNDLNLWRPIIIKSRNKFLLLFFLFIFYRIFFSRNTFNKFIFIDSVIQQIYLLNSDMSYFHCAFFLWEHPFSKKMAFSWRKHRKYRKRYFLISSTDQKFGQQSFFLRKSQDKINTRKKS